jgi:GYF domain 2
MADTWNISVGGRSYGPYTLEQMRSFVTEGRLAPHSLVAPAGSADFSVASEQSALARLFAPAPAPGPGPSATGKFVTASGVEIDEETISPTFGRSSDEPRTGDRGRFVVIADMKSRSITGLEEEIFNLGPAYSIMPQAWLVTSDLAINAIRNTLVQKLGKLDMLFIVDATHNKAAWFNFGPESDTRIRRVWTAQHEPIKKVG